MPEPEAQNPELDKALAEKELAEKRIAEIRDLVSEHVATTPTEGYVAAREAENFGLNPDDYVVFGDTKVMLRGGFVRFIPKDGESPALDGVTYFTSGGPTNNLHHYAYHMLLQPNGDMAGNVTIEDNENSDTAGLAAAPSEDPAELAAYLGSVKAMHRRAQELAQLAQAEQEASAAPEEAPEASRAHKRGRGLLGLLKNRS